MTKRPESYNIAHAIVGDSFISTSAITTSSPFVGYYYIFETIIWEWNGEERTRMKHQIAHKSEKEAAKVHDYIVKNMKNAEKHKENES